MHAILKALPAHLQQMQEKKEKDKEKEKDAAEKEKPKNWSESIYLDFHILNWHKKNCVMYVYILFIRYIIDVKLFVVLTMQLML